MIIHPDGRVKGRMAITAMVVLSLAACDGLPTNEAQPPADIQPATGQDTSTRPAETAKPAESTRPVAPLSGVSIMRPSVVEVAPPPPPPPQPLRAEISFANAVQDLDDAARAQLDALVQKPEMQSGGAIILRGHTDSRGADSDNQRVSRARARAVADYLLEKGISANRISIVALGETRPQAPNANLDGSDDPEGRARNRRVEIEVLPPLVDAAVDAEAAGQPVDNETRAAEAASP